MIQPERITVLSDQPAPGGRYVLYWIQASQRAQWNHALEYALEQANARRLPAVAVFGLTDAYPEANLRHYRFLLEGLAELVPAMAQRGVQLVVHLGPPDAVVLKMAQAAALLVCDRGYTRVQRQWRAAVATRAPCPMIEVESDAVVPVETASDKEEYAAATLRPKLRRCLARFLVPLAPVRLKKDSLSLRLDGENLRDIDALLRRLRLDRSVGPVARFRGGATQAHEHLRTFIRKTLRHYATIRNDPGLDIQSHMSPYLHFGQISPLDIALAVRRANGASPAAKEAYLEELIVRRELSLNFVWYNSRYDTFGALPNWARATLDVHARDVRRPRYTRSQLEQARTHDPYWNAAMREMLFTGKMHNYMRMYWGKKILEWTASPRQAFASILYLNNKYFLDGRDPVSYGNVAWCLGKHDRPWRERPIFGKVRYMNAAGLERKFDMAAYMRRIEGFTATD